MKKGICTNYFNGCSKADEIDPKKKVVMVPDGADFICPECKRDLSPASPPFPSFPRRLVLLGGFVILAAGGLWTYLGHSHHGADASVEQLLTDVWPWLK